MRRNLPQPLHSGVLHRRGGVEALGDRTGDKRGAPFLEKGDQPLLLGHQRIDARGLEVEERRDGAFVGE